VRRHPWRSSLAVRWAYGLRITLPIACGAARLPIVVFLTGSAISALSWGYIFTILGWAFGHTLLLVLHHVRRYEWYVVGVILIASAIGVWIARRRHVENTSLEVLSKGDEKAAPLP
jgi:membrane protein DedA with SNARE-associated domain